MSGEQWPDEEPESPYTVDPGPHGMGPAVWPTLTFDPQDEPEGWPGMDGPCNVCGDPACRRWWHL